MCIEKRKIKDTNPNKYHFVYIIGHKSSRKLLHLKKLYNYQSETHVPKIQTKTPSYIYFTLQVKYSPRIFYNRVELATNTKRSRPLESLIPRN